MGDRFLITNVRPWRAPPRQSAPGDCAPRAMGQIGGASHRKNFDNWSRDCWRSSARYARCKPPLNSNRGFEKIGATSGS
jgi:hypothetical protein